jgi:hypothetical protein
MKKKLIYLGIISVIMIPNVSAQRGCCSHHGGVNGCSSSGRSVCNDGTISPTCTCESSLDSSKESSKQSTNVSSQSISGCNDEYAINYNSKSTIDDGTCQFKRLADEEEIVNYKTIYKEDTSIEPNTKKVSVEGKNGLKINTYEEIIDAKGNIISKKLINSKTTKEVINEEVLTNTKNSSNPAGTVLGLGTISGITYLIVKRKKQSNNLN